MSEMLPFQRNYVVAPAGGDAPSTKEEKKDPKKKKDEKEEELKEDKKKKIEEPKEDKKKKKKIEVIDIGEQQEAEVLTPTPSQIAREEAEFRALQRRQRFKRHWPEITKVKIITKPWHPPPPPQRMPPITVELPELVTRRWIPPYRRARRPRKRLPRLLPAETAKPLYEGIKLKKIWHNFGQVEKNKMMLQGSIGCNSKRYSSTACGAQTGCIAAVCRALLEEKTAAELVRRDVDECIAVGDNYYKRCAVALKCYKGKPKFQLHQLLTSFFLHDTKYTIKMNEADSGVLARHPDSVQNQPDLMTLMEKRTGQTYMFILTVGNDRHFLIWGHPPTDGGACKTIAYIFDPHMLDDAGRPHSLFGAGAFLRYAGITSFVVDFLTNYGDLDAAKKGKKPPIMLTSIEVVQKEPLERYPTYELDMKALNIHCRAEWDSMHINQLIEKKIYQGKYPLCSLSAVSIATSRANDRNKVKEFYQKMPKEPQPVLPMLPEKGPPGPTMDVIMSQRGEDFFLYCPKGDAHTFGRDDLIPLPKSETLLHSPVDVADKNYHSQYQQLDAEKYLLRGTRHFASYRYQMFKSYTGVACCVVALAMLTRLRARAWNEDIVDETLDIGWNYLRESLLERGGPVRRLVLGELKETFRIRDQEYSHKERGIAVWGKIMSTNPKVFDLCRGLDTFFKESDSGVLQVPGEFESAIWNEGGKFYLYHPWPADRYGKRVSLQGGGKACVLYFTRIAHMCEHLLDSFQDLSRRPFSISDVNIIKRSQDIPEPINHLTPVAPGRWVVRGNFHEGDDKFPEDHRFKQATPMSIVALAMSQLKNADEWTPEDVDEILVRGDILYQNTMEHLERMGISLETPKLESEEGGEEEDEKGPSGTLAAADVMNKFMVTDLDCIETDVMDSAFNGSLNPEPGSGVVSLKDSLKALFNSHTHGIVTARGGSHGVWKNGKEYYMFEPHGCDTNGYPSDEARSGACLVKVAGSVSKLADAIMANLAPGADDSFNISPVNIQHARLNPELAAPETKLDSKAFQWIKRGAAAIMLGPRGENTAIGKLAKKANIGADDMAGRSLALPAAAAFAAASVAVPPQYMHQDHMYNFLDAGTDYYINHVKKTGRKDIVPEDLTEKFEMGANTFSIELGEPIKLPLRLPDEPEGEGAEEEEEKELGEGEEEEGEVMKEMKDLLMKMWSDHTKPSTISILYGDYHGGLGVWMSAGGKVVAFDPAPTLFKGKLTDQRIIKGDELRLQRIKDEMTGEGAGEEEEEELGGEGEEKPEPPPQEVPKESCPALMVFASPKEFIDKLTLQGGLDRKQCLAPYKLYPVTVINELTSLLKEKKPAKEAKEAEDAGEEDEDALVEALDDEAMGPHFGRMGRTVASVRGRVGQDENYFMDSQRDLQDAANAVMGVVVHHIEPYTFWKPPLIDAILKYGDRLYTMSLPKASSPPNLKPTECANSFHVTSFNVRTEIEDEAVSGDLNAGETGAVLNLTRGIKRFLENHQYGVLCAKNYCVALWKAADDKALVLWEPHCVGPTGRTSSAGAAGAILYSTPEALAETFIHNVKGLARPGGNKFSIYPVKVFWEISKTTQEVTSQGAVPDEGYEWKVLTAFVETAKGRTILRGSRPCDLSKFTRECLLQSSASAVVAACMAKVHRPHLWTRGTVDEVMSIGCKVFAASIGSLGYEFRPGDDVLLPLQVVKRFVLGVNYVRYDLQQLFSGRLEQREPTGVTVRAALEHFFETHTHGVLWSCPHAVAVWRASGAPAYYMMEPHACGPTGLRIDAQDDGAACVLTFTSPKLMAFAYLQNIPVADHQKHEYRLYGMSISVQPIKRLGAVDPPLIREPPSGDRKLVPATSKVGVDGKRRRASEKDRKHPPGSATCLDAQRASDKKDKEEAKLKGQRNTSGWLVLNDGTQFLSAQHSMACKKFPYGSRGNQAISCSVMAVAMSRVQDVCRWCSSTLDQVLEAGDQLHQDSYLHFKPTRKILAMGQVLRKFYTPGNCVCRVVVYQPRQKGIVDVDLLEQVTEFFLEERCGVFVAGNGEFAVALFRTPRGYYMFDPADRDRYGRAVAPACRGKARACFSQYPNVETLVDKLGPNIPPVTNTELITTFVKKDEEEQVEGSPTDSKKGSPTDSKKGSPTDSKKGSPTDSKKGSPPGSKRASRDVSGANTEVKIEEQSVSFEESAPFVIYGMQVTSLRRLNKLEK